MQPQDNSRMSRRLAGLSPITAPLENLNRPNPHDSTATTTANATNAPTFNDTPSTTTSVRQV